MSFFHRVALQDSLPFKVAASPSRSRDIKIRTLFGHWVALLLVTAFGSAVVTPALAAGASPATRPISFYSEILDSISSNAPLDVRPSMLLLAEDGSVALVHLKWSGWGTSVARATGVWSASDCTPDCADGKLTTHPAQLTLSSPGLVFGHRVYRCFQVTPANPQRDPEDAGCIQQQGTSYTYSPATTKK